MPVCHGDVRHDWTAAKNLAQTPRSKGCWTFDLGFVRFWKEISQSVGPHCFSLQRFFGMLLMSALCRIALYPALFDDPGSAASRVMNALHVPSGGRRGK